MHQSKNLSLSQQVEALSDTLLSLDSELQSLSRKLHSALNLLHYLVEQLPVEQQPTDGKASVEKDGLLSHVVLGPSVEKTTSETIHVKAELEDLLRMGYLLIVGPDVDSEEKAI